MQMYFDISVIYCRKNTLTLSLSHMHHNIYLHIILIIFTIKRTDIPLYFLCTQLHFWSADLFIYPL
jgi:hypothetical protein